MTRNSAALHPVWENLLAGIQPPRLITLVGGGGKTSLMYYLVAGLKAKGLPAVAATTTKIYPPQGGGHRTVLVDTLDEARQAVAMALAGPQTLTLARRNDGSKLAGLDPAWLDALAAEFGDVVFVVEGDGAAGRPLKGHLAHEPAVPAATALLVPVVGSEAIGQPLDAGHVHRPEQAAALAGAAVGQPVSVETVARLLLHPRGYLHNCPTAARVVPFINKAEDCPRRAAARCLAATVLAAGHPAVNGIVIGSIESSAFELIRK